jgi:hypothetical protein
MTTAIDTIINDAGQFLSGNNIYSQYKDQWQYMLESYTGGDEYRQAGHLTKYVNESVGEYNARLLTTPLQNHCNSVISVYNSFLFRNPPHRNYGSIERLPELEQFLYDADMDGRSFNSFMKDVATQASIFGACWVVVAKPNIGANTRIDEMTQGIRPYVNILSPLVVLDWSWKRNINGSYSLDYFKYIEDVNGEITTCKEWTEDEIKTTIIDTEENAIRETYTEINGLGKIPAVIAYNKRSIIRGIGISDIADIADAQKYIYNALSEIEQSIRLDSHPSLVKTPDTNAGVGAGAVIHIPDNLDPGLKPYVLDFAGASVEKILATIQETVASIDKMANTGAVRATQSSTMSGVAMETEFQLLNARLSEKGDALELAEEQIWRLWAEYQGYSWDGIVEYPDSFNLRDVQNDLDLFLKASTANINSETYRRGLAKQIATTVIDDETLHPKISAEIDRAPSGDYSSMGEEMTVEPHEMTNPNTGETRMVMDYEEHETLTSQGWINT